jgi:hypothetical protein
MKILPLLTCLLSLVALLPLQSAEKQSHKTIPGPQGGKVIEVTSGHAEFFVQPDRKIAVRFYGQDMKPQPLGAQVIKVTAQTPTPASLEFEKVDSAFISKTTLPAGDGYMLVLQIKADATAKPQNYRIKLDMGMCSGCQKNEYACHCEGHNH